MKWLCKPFLWLITGVFPVFIAACYGPPSDGGIVEENARGKVVDRATGKWISFLKVICLGKNDNMIDETYTLPGDGAFELWYPNSEPCVFLEVEDVDGADNGGDYLGERVRWQVGDQPTIAVDRR